MTVGKSVSLTYYACPHCQQNRHRFFGKLVVFLDDQLSDSQYLTWDVLYVNWFQIDRDCVPEAVEIRSASDEAWNGLSFD